MTQHVFHTGSITDGQGDAPDVRGEGVGTFVLDGETGRMECQGYLAGLQNPTYVIKDPAEPNRLFAVCENFKASSGVAMIHVSPGGRLRVTSLERTPGVSACHVAAHQGRLYVASFGSGDLSVFRHTERDIQPISQRELYTGSSVDPKRQTQSRAHQAVVSPDGTTLYVTDLGADAVWCHRISADGIGPAHDPAVRTPPGSGPRHMIFHPSLPIVYILCELSLELLVAAWHADTGHLEIVQRLAGLSRPIQQGSSGAAIRLHPGGHTLYCSFRGIDMIGAYRIDADGRLERIAEVSTGASYPRDFDISPDGRWLVVAHQKGHALASIPVGDSGVPEGVAATAPCGSAVCVLFR